jgi:hypothetical protein
MENKNKSREVGCGEPILGFIFIISGIVLFFSNSNFKVFSVILIGIGIIILQNS